MKSVELSGHPAPDWDGWRRARPRTGPPSPARTGPRSACQQSESPTTGRPASQEAGQPLPRVVRGEDQDDQRRRPSARPRRRRSCRGSRRPTAGSGRWPAARWCVPMSWPASTSRARIAAPGMSGISSWRESVSWRSFSLRASRSAPHTANASLANSEGWMVRPASTISRVPPAIVYADHPHQQQAEHGQADHRVGRGPVQPGRGPGGQPHHAQAGQRAQQLLLERGERRLVQVQGVGQRAGQHQRQPDGQQQHRAADDQVVRGERPVQQPEQPGRRALAAAPGSGSAAARRPARPSVSLIAVPPPSAS